jgi:DNA-binding transcriptional MerR regulator
MPVPEIVGSASAEPPAGAESPDPQAELDPPPAEPGDPGPAAVAQPPLYTVAAVARRLGVAPSTLRTWARRYRLGPSDHAAGAHRRYSAADVARLEVMRRHVLDGVPPAHAARIALAAGPAADPPAPDSPAPDPPATHRVDRLGARQGSPAAERIETEFPDALPGGPGGRILPLPGGTPTERGLARAAMALDAAAASRIIREQLAATGVVATWTGLLAPVLVAAGLRWEMTAQGVDVEHLLSEAVIAALRGVVSAATLPPERRSLLLASAEDEYHSLPLYAIAAALAERGIGCRMLGAALPGDALRAAVRRLGPAGLFVWSQVPRTAAADALVALPQTRPPTTIVVGGPGWEGVSLPERITVTGSLEDAVALLAAAAGPRGLPG